MMQNVYLAIALAPLLASMVAGLGGRKRDGVVDHSFPSGVYSNEDVVRRNVVRTRARTRPACR